MPTRGRLQSPCSPTLRRPREACHPTPLRDLAPPYGSPSSRVAIATSCRIGELISKPRLRKVVSMRLLSLAISATTCLHAPRLRQFQAIVGQHPAQSAALPAVDHDHRIFGRLMVDVGHQPADADQLPLAFFLDLGHDAPIRDRSR